MSRACNKCLCSKKELERGFCCTATLITTTTKLYRADYKPTRMDVGGFFLQNCDFPTSNRTIESNQMPFPIHRPRRLRSTESIRRVVRETRLEPANFILPLFICPGEGVQKTIGSMPPHCQLSIDVAVEECREVRDLGIGGVILFGLPESKDDEASGAYDDQGIVQRAIRAIKRHVPTDTPRANLP